MKQSAMGCGPGFRKQFRGQYPFERHMGMKRPKYNVPVNITENEEAFVAYVFAVGFNKEDIRISAVNDTLYVSGTRNVDEESKPEFTWQEFPVKNFERTLSLNGKVDAEKISAKSEGGILIITLPKNEEAIKKEQTITVQ